MTDDNPQSASRPWRIRALGYSVVYLILAGLWILLSGHALDYFTGLAEIRPDLEVYKGLFFVLLTTLALYTLLCSWQDGLPGSIDLHQRGARSSWAGVKLPVYYLLGLLLVVACGGYVTYEHLKRKELRSIEQNLASVATLKAEQINGWFRQNINFAMAAGNGSYLAGSFAEWRRNGKLPKEREEWVRRRMEILKQGHAQGELSLMDLDGKAFAFTGNGVPPSVVEHLPGLLQRAAVAAQPTLGELHWHVREDGSRSLSLPLLAPLRPSGEGSDAVGLLVFEMNPQQLLLPLAESWSASSASGEIMLVRRVGDEVVFLNELRHRKGMVLEKMKIESWPSLLSAQAVTGKMGYLTGRDYRDIPVVGYVAKIPDTDWLVVSKIDADEIHLPIRRMAFNVTLTAFLLALIGGLSLYLWLRQRRARIETAQIKAELQQQILTQQLDYLSKYANDIILLMDEEGVILQINDRAEAAYGYTHDELIGMNIGMLRLEDQKGDTEQIRQQLVEKKGLLFEARHRRRDGGAFPVEVSTRLIETGRGNFIQSVIRDISERKQAEAALRSSEWSLSTMFNNMTNGIALYEVMWDAEGKVLDYRFLKVNPAFEKMTGLTRDKIIGRNLKEVLPEVEQYWIDNFGEIATSGRPKYLENFAASLGRWYSVYAYRPAQDQVAAVVQDISDRKQVEMREQRLKNTLRILGEINGAIVRMEDEKALFPMVCRITADFGGMSLAWVGAPDDETGKIVTQASAGKAKAYINAITILSTPDAPEGNGPVGITYREKRTVVINDFQNADSIAPWREQAIVHGLKSIATFPILRPGKSCAVFAVYSEHADAFEEEIVGLLDGMAKGMSFALENFEREAARSRAESALRQSEARFRLVAEEAPFPMQIHAEDGEILLINRAWTDITGYSIEDIPTISDWVEKACGEQAPAARSNIQSNFTRTGRRVSDEYSIRCKDGTLRIWYFISSPLSKLDDGRRTVISMAVDITERRKAEEELRLAATVFESSHGAIIIADGRARIVAVNPAFSEITGYSPEEVIGKNSNILSSGRQGRDFYRTFWADLERSGNWQGELWNRRKNGEEYATWLSVSAIRDENGVVKQYIGISDDITESKESQSKIQFLAYHDTLTGLPNRLLASDRLEQAIAHAHRVKTRVAVLFLDLDDFKTINDTLGHTTGDTMLKAVADRLRHCVGEADTVSRQGGDEFMVMLSDVSDLEAINSVAIEILDKVNRPYRLEEHNLTISTSIGIAIYPEDGQDCDTLMKNADMAMYNAKQSGRNTHRFFAEEMNSYVLEHLLIRNGLMRALENKEFHLHYQPQYDMASGRLVGAEALIRWQHPELGMVPPNRFIQVAEESGMIIPIGEWVLHEACRQAKAWHDTGHPGLVVGVNISAVQFRRGDMEQIVSAALAESGLSGQFLELELTESILIQDVGKSLEMIHRLKDLGVRLSIDDFGTGYSSLAYLRQLPVDKLKIDQSFVREITSRKDDAAIALSIITLAHTMQKKVIAEGVETQEQLRFMREHHCDEVQGYLLSRPLPMDAFHAFLKNGARIEDLVRD